MVPIFGTWKDLAHFRSANHVLLEGGFEQTDHGVSHIVKQLINDIVVADVHVLGIRKFLHFGLGTDVERENDGVGSRCKHDVSLCDRTRSAVNDADFHLVGRELVERIDESFQ
jgi:hypothetical protein